MKYQIKGWGNMVKLAVEVDWEMKAKLYQMATEQGVSLSENKSLMKSYETLGYANDELIKRNERLEKALFDMVVQFCQMDKEGYLHNTFMSAEENAFAILGIKYGEKVDDVRKKKT